MANYFFIPNSQLLFEVKEVIQKNGSKKGISAIRDSEYYFKEAATLSSVEKEMERCTFERTILSDVHYRITSNSWIEGFHHLKTILNFIKPKYLISYKTIHSWILNLENDVIDPVLQEIDFYLGVIGLFYFMDENKGLLLDNQFDILPKIKSLYEFKNNYLLQLEKMRKAQRLYKLVGLEVQKGK